MENSFETPSLAEPKKAVAPAATLLPKAPMLAAGPAAEGLVLAPPAVAPTPALAAASLALGAGVGLEPGAVAPGDAGPRFTLLLIKPIGLLNMLDMAFQTSAVVSASVSASADRRIGDWISECAAGSGRGIADVDREMRAGRESETASEGTSRGGDGAEDGDSDARSQAMAIDLFSIAPSSASNISQFPKSH